MPRATASLLRPLAPAVVLLATACNPQAPGPAGAGSRLLVVATTGMVADAARAIGGEHVEVLGLMGPGVDPHLYDATREDQKRLARADLVLYHGLHLEGKMADFLKRLRENPRPNQLVVAAGEAVPESELLRNEAFAEYPDPHIWFDITLWKLVVAEIGRALQTRDPEHAPAYERAMSEYLAELDRTHAWAVERIEGLPPSRRKMVTSHDAYNYFARAYGFEVHGLQGISTETQPGLDSIRRAVAYIQEHGIPVIFAETSVRRDAIERVAVESGARVCEHELYSDALGKPGSGADTFAGMFRYNVETIASALAPARVEASR